MVGTVNVAYVFWPFTSTLIVVEFTIMIESPKLFSEPIIALLLNVVG